MILNNLKKTVCVMALTTTLLLGGCAKKGPEGVASIVNGTEITEEQYIREYAANRNKYVSMAGGEEMLTQPSPEDPKKTMDELIKELALKNLQQIELVKQDAEKLGIKTDEAVVDARIKEIIEQSGGEENYKAQLKNIGQTPEFYREYLATMELLQQYSKKKMDDLKPKDEEISKYYDEHKSDYATVKASHILVKELEEAKDIKKQLDEGADFATLAKEKSQDPGSAKDGGSLGEFNPGQMVKEFKDALAKMEEGTISEPVKSQFGYHIIKMEKKTEKSLEDVKAIISEQLTTKNFEKYIEKLTKDAKIETFVDFKKELAVPEELKIKLPEKQDPAQQPQDESKTNEAAKQQANTAEEKKTDDKENNSKKNAK